MTARHWRMPWLLLAGLVAVSAHAQVWATNRDGSVLYFSSANRIKGTSQYLYPKIFVWDPIRGVRLFDQRDSDVPVDPLEGWVGAKYYSLEGVDVSADGSVVVVTGSRECNGGPLCGTIERYQTAVLLQGEPSTFPGGGTLSRNGRYLLVHPTYNASVTGLSSLSLFDLASGETSSYEAYILGAGYFGLGSARRVADDGTVLLNNSSGLVLGKNGQYTPLGIQAWMGMINDAGTLIVYVGPNAYSIPARQALSLAGGPAVVSTSATMSDDGSVIAYTQQDGISAYGDIYQIYVVNADGSGKRKLTSVASGAVARAISGDGKIIFARTGADEIARIDVVSGEATIIVPASPGVSPAGFRRAGPGTLQEITGGAWTEKALSAEPPYPTSLGGVQVIVNGRPAPLVSVSPRLIEYQAPWDLPTGFSDVEVHTTYSNDGPFWAGFPLAPMGAAFDKRMVYPSQATILVAAHEDFSGILFPEIPGRPGEIVHAYAFGLGPVTPIPTPGLPAPSAPPAALNAPLTCVFENTGDPSTDGTQVAVLFAGLAPAMYGVYQIDLQLPKISTPNRLVTLGCRVGDSSLSGILPFASEGS